MDVMGIPHFLCCGLLTVPVPYMVSDIVRTVPFLHAQVLQLAVQVMRHVNYCYLWCIHMRPI